jgi:tetratricopeptide (TPR) repeat protein
MPLQDLVYDQLADLAVFCEPSPVKLWHWRFPVDLKHVIIRILDGLQHEPDNATLHVYIDVPAEAPDGYFSQVREELEKELKEYEHEFQQVGVAIPARQPEKGTFAEKLARRVDTVVAAFPKDSGSMLIILDPGAIPDPAGFAGGIKALVAAAQHEKTKFLLLDVGSAPELTKLREAGAAFTGQDFQLNPVAIEKQVKADLASGKLNDAEKRQYTAMAGSFAFANRNLDEATKYQTEAVKLAEQNGDPADTAVALYNLGNTHLKAQRLPDAEKTFERAAELALEADRKNLLGMTLLNLGVTYSRQGRIDDAVKTLDVGRQAFAAEAQLPGEIHALDTKAAALFEAKKNPEAEAAWREALLLVLNIKNPDMAELKKSTRDDLFDKLERFYKATGQNDKVRDLAVERKT